MRSRIVGEVNIVGDKSISHRAIILSSLASGKSILSNVLISGDTKATINTVSYTHLTLPTINWV